MSIRERIIRNKAFNVKVPTSRSLTPNQKILPIANDYNMGIVGGAGTGKTTAALRILKTLSLLETPPTKVYWVSPTAHLDQKTQDLEAYAVENLSLVEEAIETQVENQIVYKEALEQAQKRILTSTNNRIYLRTLAEINRLEALIVPDLRFLIIFDDLSGTKDLSNPRSPIVQLCLKRRHLKTSMMFLAQAYKTINKTIRENFTDLVLLGNLNENSLRSVYEEFAHPKLRSYEDLWAYYLYATKGSYNFLTLLQQGGSLRKNLNIDLI